MSKNLLFKLLVSLVFVAVAVLGLLSAIGVITINLIWLVGGFCGVLGILILFKGLFGKGYLSKKFNIFLAMALLAASAIAFVGAFVPELNLVFPIIALAITVGVFLCILATGGKKWDQGDNENVGYKNYYERKKEKEKAEAENEKEG